MEISKDGTMFISSENWILKKQPLNDLSLVKRLEFFVSIHEMNQQIKKYFEEDIMKYYQQIKELKYVTLSLNAHNKGQIEDLKILREEMIEFVKKKIILTHCETIEYLEILGIQLFVEPIDNKDEEKFIEEFIESLLLPLKNLKGIILSSQLKYLNFHQYIILDKILKVINKNKENFKQLEYFKIDYQQENTSFKTDKMLSKKISQMLINSSQQISTIHSLQTLDVQLNDFQLDQNFCTEFFSNILKLNKLTSLGIDLSNNSIQPSNCVSNLKTISTIADRLVRLTFIDNQYLKASNIKIFSSIISTFQNLKTLQMEGLTIKKDGVKQFFDAFKCLKKLNTLILDLEQVELNYGNNYEYCFKIMTNLKDLENIQITLPIQKIIKKEQTKVISQFISSFKNQLKDLQLTTNNIIEEDSLLIQSIVESKKLERLRIDNSSQHDDDLFFEIDIKKNLLEKGASNIFELTTQKLKIDDNIDFQFKKQSMDFIAFKVLLNLAIICESTNIKILKLNSYAQIDEDLFFMDQDRKKQLFYYLKQLSNLKQIETIRLNHFQNAQYCIQNLIQNNKDSLKVLTMYDSFTILNYLEEDQLFYEDEDESDQTEQNNSQNKINKKIANKKKTKYQSRNEEEIDEDQDEDNAQQIEEEEQEEEEEEEEVGNEMDHDNNDGDKQSQNNDSFEGDDQVMRKYEQQWFFNEICKCKNLIHLNIYEMYFNEIPYSKMIIELPNLQTLILQLRELEFSNEDFENTLHAKYLCTLEDSEGETYFTDLPYIYILYKRSVITSIYAFEKVIEPNFNFNYLHLIWDLYY